MQLYLLLAAIMPCISAIPSMTVLSTGDKPDESACLRSCFNDKPACPDNMVAKELGKCWTCCLRLTHERGLRPLNEQDPGLPGEHSASCRRATDYCCTADGCAWCCGNLHCNTPPFDWQGYCWG
ncbi:hypothetical protein BDW60DRAFT_191657 [Aspergillus nidulans var. acristatus]